LKTVPGDRESFLPVITRRFGSRQAQELERRRSGRTFTLFASKRAKKRTETSLADKTRRKRAGCWRSLTQESHLDEKVRSAETIEREQREQLATFESMLANEGKPALRDNAAF
jgi:hypothetical protein